ncbi:hypothetical protein [Microbacterium sp.]|uniref:hypothetical protein n=1 Tax=Microbacterium sp. TaxID=51671 RepID=UPI0025FFC53F|nr:hypothetical protein [Microbacterium sp.]MBT9607371.1 hypothetical protein [Microbacterium sp.]
MPRHIGIEDARALVRSREQLLDFDGSVAVLRAAVRDGSLVRLHRDAYVYADALDDLWPDGRHLVRVVAAHLGMTGGAAVMSHRSAAVLHGLAQPYLADAPVETTTIGDVRMSGRAGLRRHSDRLPDDDVVEVSGIRCTSVDRTVFDVARTCSVDVGVSCADAAARKEALCGRDFDSDAQDRWRERLLGRAVASPGRRGVVRARRVLRFADGRAQLPGESVSRVQLARLGFRDFELQVRVDGPGRREYFVDIGLPESRTFWEFDGEGKYAASTDGRTLADVLLDEKRREDWIRGVTQWRFTRGGWRDIATPVALRARLEAFGVPLPR